MRKQKPLKNKPIIGEKPLLKIQILSLFPKIFKGYLRESFIGKAQKKDVVEIKVFNIRGWAKDTHKTADDKPYGGGPGMVLKAGPIVNALKDLRREDSYVVLLSPRGTKLTQQKVMKLSKLKHIILICGHYEGVDQRIADYYVNEEISIGDYVLSGGESAAIVLVDAITRLIPKFLGNELSLADESFNNNLLESHQYTRPGVFEGHRVPEILLSGDHKEIDRWRKNESLALTKDRRPDLISN